MWDICNSLNDDLEAHKRAGLLSGLICGIRGYSVQKNVRKALINGNVTCIHNYMLG